MAESKYDRAARARKAVAKALQEFEPVAKKFGSLPELFENFAHSILDQAEEEAARIREEESRGRREAEAFIAQLSGFYEEDAAELEANLEAERGKREAAERKAQESEKTLADLQAKIPGVTLTGQAPATAPTPAAPLAPVNRKAPAGYEIQIRRGGDDLIHSLKLLPKGDGLGYTASVHRDAAGLMRSLTLTPEAAH